MDKNMITDADIDTLIKASSELKPGEMVTGTLTTNTIGQNTGTPKTIKAFVKDYSDGQIINFSGAPIIGEGIKGEAFIEAFKNAKLNTGKKEPFSIKRSFFTAIDKLVSSVNNMRLNFFKVIYQSDEFGRVYIVCDDKRHYLNKERTHYITEDGLYGEIKFNKDGTVDLVYIDSEDAIYDDPNFIGFSYLYISPGATKRGEQLIREEEEHWFEEFIKANPLLEGDYYATLFQEEAPTVSSKVVDLEEYRRSLEEEGPHR